MRLGDDRFESIDEDGQQRCWQSAGWPQPVGPCHDGVLLLSVSGYIRLKFRHLYSQMTDPVHNLDRRLLGYQCC